MRAVVLLCLVAVAAGQDPIYCMYDTGLMNDYLSDEANLYCSDSPLGITVNADTKLCSETEFFTIDRGDDMTVACADTYTTVGYTSYACDTDTGELASALSADSILIQYSSCTNNTDAVCSSVQTAAATSKLLVDTSYSVDNVDLQTADDTSIIYYSLICDDGYGFSADVTETVYGYCSNNTDENEYTFHASSQSSACFEMCPASPGSSEIDSEPANFDSADFVAQQSGASVSTAITCDEGFDLVSGADEQYTFTCNGAELGDTPYGGSYSCDTCPVCVATCPANPTATEIQDLLDNVVSLVIAGESQSQLVVDAGVVCDTGYSIDVSAAQSYSFLCNSSSSTEASAGLYVLVGDAPVCQPTCGSNAVDDMDSVSLIEIAAGDYGVVSNGTVHCDSTHSLTDGEDDQYEFVCANGTDEAAGGVWDCYGDCPVCEEKCTLPTDDDEFEYESESEDESGEVPHGEGHIEISCKNTSLNLVGSKYVSCLSGANLTFTAEEEPECLDTEICEAPEVMNGEVSTQDNVEVGDVYTITCNPSHYFDHTTAEAYAPVIPITEADYSEIEVTCEGDELPDFSCYFGCLPPDFPLGTAYPDSNEDGAAPYEMGAAVTFNCLDGSNIEAGTAEATCEVGGIGSPVCGACSFSLAFSLLSSLLVFLLL